MKIENDLSLRVRAALYVRVSTEEQALHGLSIEAQTDALDAWAKANHVQVVDHYTDAGISARKPASRRPELQRLLRDAQAGKIDLIVFTKLDRWFRNIAEYCKVQEVLEKYHVCWQAIQEDYDTTTSSGRFKVNIMLSVAENEADRTSERIKAVFASKLERCEAITGKVPPGFKIENKHLVHDPEKIDMVRDLFHHYAENGSKHGAIQYIYDTYGVEIDRHYFQHMLQNTLYKGEYHGIRDFCEPIIDAEMFNYLRTMKNIKLAPTRRIYIFSGLIVCASCGHRMSGRHAPSTKNGENIYYRCNRYSNYKACTNGKLASETDIEKWLLDNVEDEIRKCLLAYDMSSVAKKVKKASVDRAAIRRKLSLLKDLYVNEMIDLDAYRRDYEQYTAQLAEISEPDKPTINIQGLKDFLSSDFKTDYQNLDRENKRTFWRSIIREIRIDIQKNITIYFA